MQIETIVTHAITAVLSTVSSVVICFLTLRNKASMSQAEAKNVDRVTLSNEMHTEIRSLKDEINKKGRDMQAEIDSWREKYNIMFIKCGMLELKMNAMETQLNFLKDQAPEAQTRIFDNILTEHYERPKETDRTSLR